MPRFLQTTLLLLLATSAIAAAPPRDSGRLPIAEPATRATSAVGSPQVVSDGENFFAVWTDGLYDISGARFTASGEPVNAEESPIITTWQFESSPAVAWNGRDYVTLASAGALGIRKARIDRAGGVHAAGAPIDRIPWSAPSFVWNGSHYAYLLQENEAMTLMILDDHLDVIKIVPVGTGLPGRYAQIASDGSDFLIVWQTTPEEAGIWFERFDTDGVSLAPAQKITSAVAWNPAITWNDNHYFVVWTADAVEGALIGRDGTLGDRFTISNETGASNAAVGWDGFTNLVTWTQRTGLLTPEGAYAVRPAAAFVSSTGQVRETFTVSGASERYASRASIASNGDVFFLIWFGERFVISSTATPRIVRRTPAVTERYMAQRSPVIAASSSTSTVLAAWFEDDTIYVGRLSRTGQPLDGSGIAVARDESAGIPKLDLVRSGATYLLYWRDSTAVRGTRVTADGKPMDSAPFTIAAAGSAPVVAATPAGFRIFWSKGPSPSLPGAILSVEIPATGPIATIEPKALTSDPRFHVPNAAFWNGDGFTLLWTQQLLQPCFGSRCPPTHWELRATTLTKAADLVATRVVVSDAVFLDAVATNDDKIVVAYWSGGVFTQQLSARGEQLRPPVAVAVTLFPVFDAHLVRTSSGHALVYTFSTGPAGSTIQLTYLDAAGSPTGAGTALVLDDYSAVSSLTSAWGELWLAYTTSWLPRPDANDRSVTRAYVSVLRPHTRAVGKR